MKTRNGKIARLPKAIREQLNQRLENGESGTTLVQWLNGLPEVQKILADQFAGQPIRPQNLSQWRQGGYQDWVRHQLLREQTRWTSEQSKDLNTDTHSKSVSIAEDVAMVMSAELALHVHALGTIKNAKERFRQFCLPSRELSRLRRDDQRYLRHELCRQKWESTLEPLEPEAAQDTETPEPEENPNPPQPTGKIVDPPPVQSSRPAPEPEKPTTAPINSSPTPPSEPAPTPETLSPTLPSDSASKPETQHMEPETPNLKPETHLPIPPNPTESHYKILTTPIRGRRFTCIEG